MENSKQSVVISLGGSLLFTEGEYNIPYIRLFRDEIKTDLHVGQSFIVVTGGGDLNRMCNKTLSDLYPDILDHDLDLMGIAVTRLNAELVRQSFGADAFEHVLTDPEVGVPESPVVLSGGVRPGQSTDAVAVAYALKSGAQRIVNISTAHHVYSADPVEDPDAIQYSSLTWSEYRKIIPEVWTPRMSSPFDPVAAKLAAENGLEVAIVGRDLVNARRAWKGEGFEGTLIRN